MNTLIGWVANLAGVQKIWNALDGKKAYGVAALGALTSLAGLGLELAPILAAHNTIALLAFIQGLPRDPSWLALLAAGGLVGLRHSNDKVAAAVATAPAVENQAPPAP